MVNINSALLSMGAYLGSPTLGGGYSPAPNLGWMPGLTGQTAFSFGPAPDDSLGSLLGNQLPSRSFLRFGSADNYRIGGPGASAPLASLNLPQLAAPSFGQQQQAAPPQMIGGQINVNATGEGGEAEDAHGAHGKADTSIPEDVRKQAEKKLTGRGYSEDEAKTVMDAAWKAAGNDQKKFGEIMSSPPPVKPVGKDDAEPTEADKEKWAREYAKWFAEKVGGVPANESKGFVSEAIDAPKTARGSVQIKAVADRSLPREVGKFQITVGNGTGDYAQNKFLYRKGDKWYLDVAVTQEAEATGNPPGAGKKITTLKIGSNELKLTPGRTDATGQTYIVAEAYDHGGLKLAQGDVLYHATKKADGTSVDNWLMNSNPLKVGTTAVTGTPTPKTVGGSSTSTLTIGGGGAKLQPDLTEVVPLTERLEEAIERRKKSAEEKRVSDADKRSEFKRDILAVLKEDKLQKAFQVKVSDGAVDITSAGEGAKSVLAAVYAGRITRDEFDAAFAKLPEGTKVKLNGTEITGANGKWYDRIFRKMVSDSGFTHDKLSELAKKQPSDVKLPQSSNYLPASATAVAAAGPTSP